MSQWIKHEDVRISIPATKALANLDQDDDTLYLQRLYLLSPSTRTLKEPDIDVIFVHGLLGGVFFTWRQRKRARDILSFIGKKDLWKCVICSKNYLKLFVLLSFY